MRLFVAIQLPDDVQNYLLSLQKLFMNAGEITFVKESHLTLKFLGEVSPFVAKQVEDKLSVIKPDKFKVKLFGLGVFPDEKLAKVLWVGLNPENETIALQQKIDVVLKDFFPPEKNFKPHITIGRIKSLKNKKSFLTCIKKTKIKDLGFEVDSFALVKSELSFNSPEYFVLKDFKSQKNRK